MKLVYLKRSYLFNKVCKKTIARKYIYVLYTIHLLQSAGYTAAWQKLYFVGRKIDMPRFTQQLKYLVENGYLTKDEKRKYNLTPAGLEVLKDCERRLRIERHDR